MENSRLNNTTMNDSNTINTIHPPTSAAAAFNGVASFKPPQPPLYIPPGRVAFRLLCHASHIGALIGKCGAVVKHLEQHTNSKIRVVHPHDSGDDRIVAVISSPKITNKIKLQEENNEEWFDVSAAQEGVIRVFERLIEVAPNLGMVSCMLLVCGDQSGAVIGRGGNVVEKIKMDTGTRIAVLSSEKISFDLLSSPTDEIVEIEGDALAVKKALIAVTSRLQKRPPLDKIRMYESSPIPTVDLPMQRSPMIQPVPSNSINHTPIGGPSSLKKVPDIDSRTQQQVVFKILCPNERIGGIIGKQGSTIKALQTETGASVAIGPVLAECDERLITVTAMESVKSRNSPAQNAAVLIFNRSMEVGIVKELILGSKGSIVLARVVVSSNQVSCLLGERGAIISAMRKETGAGLRLLGGNKVPKCAPENDVVLEINGEFVNVRDALYKVTSRLRDHMFWIKMSNGNGNRDPMGTENHSYGSVRDITPIGSHLSNSILDNLNEQKSLTEGMHRLGISNNIDQAATTSSLESLLQSISRVNRKNILDISRRSPSVKGGVELGSGNGSAIVTNTTVEIVVPDTVIGFIYGENGSKLARLRQISGAKVIVLKPLPGTSESTFVISGTPDETRVAQTLLQAYILDG
ncbi:hypothetical protein BUALT_Bualt15G0061700 [Buddleja alternifolia]|uniref:K Homology domain-containing protein n=1 Tax=Buddleja alternifolia TaxID=168488 RepID=A0AAV6WD33_9LAMI|nr:hypothetical protein BUALT_Bualt15G0061700 [Buddleja alternifolia]